MAGDAVAGDAVAGDAVAGDAVAGDAVAGDAVAVACAAPVTACPPCDRHATSPLTAHRDRAAGHRPGTIWSPQPARLHPKEAAAAQLRQRLP